MPLKTLSDVLWRERDLLEALLYKLEVEQLLLTSGRTRRLPLATREVEEVLENIRAAELGRSVEVDAVAHLLRVPAGTSLLELAQAAPAPWDGIFLDHREAFIKLTSEIADLAQSNRDILTSSHHATQETLAALQQSVQTYNPSGSASTGPADAQLLDESF